MYMSHHDCLSTCSRCTSYPPESSRHLTQPTRIPTANSLGLASSLIHGHHWSRRPSMSWRSAYGIVAEPFQALNDLYTSGGDLAHALKMTSFRALNTYYEASRAGMVLSFEIFGLRNNGSPCPSLYRAVSYAWGNPTPRHKFHGTMRG